MRRFPDPPKHRTSVFWLLKTTKSFSPGLVGRNTVVNEGQTTND